MTDLRSRFQSLDRARPPDLWPEIVARAAEARVDARTMAFGTSRMVILLAALLLLGALAAGIAFGMLRTDRDDPSDLTNPAPFAFAGPISRPCDDSLPDDVALRLRGSTDAEASVPLERTVYADGLVIDGPSAEWGGTLNWSARRLSSAAAQALIESVTSGASCRSFPFDGFVTIQARGEDDVHVIGLGPDPFEVREPTAQESATVEALVEQLLDPNLGVPSSAWADPEWRPYQPDRWRFSVTFLPPAGERSAPPAADVVLPDGSSLRTFGGDSAVVDAFFARCVVRSAEEATAIASALTEAMGGPVVETPEWQFADDKGGIQVTAAGLLPHEPDCVTELPVMVPFTPVPAASVAAEGLPPLDDACDYLDPSEVFGGIQRDLVEHLQGYSADWHVCWYPLGLDRVVVASSRRPVPGKHAPEQAERLFGLEDLASEGVGNGQVFFNGCTANDGSCRSAIAISAEPHFVVVTWGDGDRDALRGLAERVLASLGASE